MRLAGAEKPAASGRRGRYNPGAAAHIAEVPMRISVLSFAFASMFVMLAGHAAAQPPQAGATPRTLVAVWAHPDDEGSVSPVLARYAREGVQVYLIIATDGAQGVANTKAARGPEVAKLRAEEARCSAAALGIQPPILLGFPDGALGSYTADPTLLYRLTQQLQEHLQRLRPDVLITWGPDGGYGHPDHRLVSSVVTQLVRAAAPGVPRRLFYSSIPAEGIRTLNPDRGVPPFVIPDASLLNVRVPVAAADFDAAGRSMACHRTQFTEEAIDRVTKAMRTVWNGAVPLSSMVPQAASNDLFQ
jgi:LmbE family N-acetylglucosaminyl deacetylase